MVAVNPGPTAGGALADATCEVVLAMWASALASCLLGSALVRSTEQGRAAGDRFWSYDAGTWVLAPLVCDGHV